MSITVDLKQQLKRAQHDLWAKQIEADRLEEMLDRQRDLIVKAREVVAEFNRALLAVA